MIKKFLLIFAIITLFTTGCGKKSAEQEVISDLDKIKNRGELIVGVREDARPFGYRDEKGNLQGLEIELSKEIALNLLDSKDKVMFVAVNPSNRIEKLNSKEVDILAATMTMTPQRLRVVDFSLPYFAAGQALMVRAKSNITSLGQAAKNGSIIAVFGTTAEKSISG